MNFSTPNPAVATSNVDSLDQFFLNMNQLGDISNAFYNAFAAAFGMTALRALHEIWIELTGKRQTPHTFINKVSIFNLFLLSL